MAWLAAARVTDIEENGCIGVEVGPIRLAIFNLGGTYYALDNICTHRFAFISEGCIDGEYIECPMHQGRFHIPSGAAQGAPVTKPLKSYPTRIDGTAVMVEVPDAS